jgi:hypothetical protein
MPPQTTCQTQRGLLEGGILPTLQSSAPASKRSGVRQISRESVHKRFKTSQQASVDYLLDGINGRSTKENIDNELLDTETMKLAPLTTKAYKLSEILTALDATEVFLNSISLARRILLVQLVEVHESTREAIERSRDGAGVPSNPEIRGVASETLDTMIMEAYPETIKEIESLQRPLWRKKYDSKRKRIQNRLQAGKVWHRAYRQLGPGILVLFPRGDHQ